MLHLLAPQLLTFAKAPPTTTMEGALAETKAQLDTLRDNRLAEVKAEAEAQGIDTSQVPEFNGDDLVDPTAFSGMDYDPGYASSCYFDCGYGTWPWAWDLFNVKCQCDPGYGGRCCDGPTTCATGAKDMCGASRYETKSHKCSEVTGEGPLSNKWQNLPKSMQGVFWLTNQGDSSALMTFGASDDGGGLSSGVLEEGDVNYEIRVQGDRVWSFADQASSWELVEGIDLVYKFRMDSATEPTKGTIDPSSPVLGLTLGEGTKWLLRFDVELVPFGTCTEECTADSTCTCYPNSITWARPSAILGLSGGYYELVQVIDADGVKVQPAFDDWVAYCEDGSKTGDSPGYMWYHQIADTQI